MANEEELEIVEVDEIPADAGAVAETPTTDAPLGDDDDGEEESRLADNEDDDDDLTPEQRAKRSKSERRKNYRKQARERKDAEIDFLRHQVAELSQRQQTIESRTYDVAAQDIDRKKSEATVKLDQIKIVMGRAAAAGNWDDFNEAQDLRDQTRDELRDLDRQRASFDTNRRQAEAPRVDPRVVDWADKWQRANPWYDSNGRDEQSRITKAIDEGLVREGFDPTREDYWLELSHRVAQRTGGGDDGPSPRRNPVPTGASREHVPTSTKNRVYVTPERKQAMVDAGYWEDPVKRAQMLRRYAEHDRTGTR